MRKKVSAEQQLAVPPVPMPPAQGCHQVHTRPSVRADGTSAHLSLNLRIWCRLPPALVEDSPIKLEYDAYVTRHAALLAEAGIDPTSAAPEELREQIARRLARRRAAHAQGQPSSGPREPDPSRRAPPRRGPTPTRHPRPFPPLRGPTPPDPTPA